MSRFVPQQLPEAEISKSVQFPHKEQVQFNSNAIVQLVDLNRVEFNEDDECEGGFRGKSNNQSKGKRKQGTFRDRSGELTVDFETMHKENVKLKTRLYEQKFKMDAIKTRLKEAESVQTHWKDKFTKEQEKTDEFYSKAEKYKLIAKDYRKEIERLSAQKNNQTHQMFEQREEFQARVAHQRQMQQQEMFKTLISIQKVAHAIDRSGVLQSLVEELFGQVQAYNTIGDQQSQTNEYSVNLKTNSEETTDNSSHLKSYQQSDSRQRYKVSQDAIVFNGESLDHREYSQQQLYQQAPSHNEQSRAQSPGQTPLRSSQSQSFYYSVAQQQDILNTQSVNGSSILGGSSNFEILSKIQQEMTKVKEDSQKVISENQLLSDKNTKLTEELEQERQRIDQSLLPQYKDAFEQLRKNNEMLQKRIEELENQKQMQSFGSKLEDDLKDLKLRLQKYDYENLNLKDEREMFIKQIQTLEDYNKNQEKIISYFQCAYSSAVHQQQQQQLMVSQSQLSSTGQQVMSQDQLEMQSLMQNSYKSNSQSLNNSHIKKIGQSYYKQRSSQIEVSQIPELDEQKSQSDISKSNFFMSSRTDPSVIVQAFSLNNLQSNNNCSDSHMSQSLLSKSNRTNSKIAQPSQLGPLERLTASGTNGIIFGTATDTSLYVDTSNNDKIDGIVSGENENNLFSLSSTQPENQFRIFSPAAPIIKHLDFQNNYNQNHIATGHFKDTLKEGNQVQVLMMHKAATNSQISTWLPIQVVEQPNKVCEEYQRQSQEVTNRDKNGGVISLNKSHNNSCSSSDIQLDQEHNNLQEELSDLASSLKARNLVQSVFTSQRESERSLENHHLEVLRQNNNIRNQNQSQETFQMRNQSIQSIQNQASAKEQQIKVSTTKSTSRGKSYYITNKENVIMAEDGILISSSKNQSSKVKSPAFYESNNNLSESDIGDSNVVFNQQMLSEQLNATKKQSSGYLNQSGAGMVASSSNQSNYMSDRTMNLKKEINSLDDEIMQLQNSLKHALLKKGNESTNF